MNPAMLLINTTAAQVVLVVVSSLVGIFGVAAALNGYLFRRISPVGRIILAAGGLLMMDPTPITDLIGIVLLAVVFAWQYFGARRSANA